MKTYIINLERRKDRMQDVQSPFEYEIFKATEGSIFDFEPSKRMRGHLGCWDSHKRLMEKIQGENNGMTLVLEDDFKFVDFNIDQYLKELPENWDLLYLGGINQDAPEPYSEKLDHAKNILQTHAYIVRDKFVPTLLNILSNHRWKVDIVFSEALKRGNCFICNPPLVIQKESKSDIS